MGKYYTYTGWWSYSVERKHATNEKIIVINQWIIRYNYNLAFLTSYNYRNYNNHYSLVYLFHVNLNYDKTLTWVLRCCEIMLSNDFYKGNIPSMWGNSLHDLLNWQGTSVAVFNR